MAINTSIFTNSSENIVVSMTQGVNTASGGWFGVGILLAAYIVLFFATLNWGVKMALASTTFVGVLLAMFFRLLEIVNDTVFYACIVIAVIALIILWMSKD